MRSGIVHRSNKFDVYENLAIEKCLLHVCKMECMPILYLWQNEKAVVIGKNQNAYTECNVEFAKNNGVSIARRITGGGAVYHDRGNINYSIILPKQIYNKEYSTNVIIKALKQLNLNVEKTGRNDICLNGKKISGNAYYTNESVGLHHGTIIHRNDPMTMEKLLTVSKSKLTKHGIASVRTRVGDIVSIQPSILVEDVMNAIEIAFVDEYKISFVKRIEINENDLKKEMLIFSSEDWNMNKICEYEMFLEKQFHWGNVRISFLYDGIDLKKIEISSDALCMEQIDELKTMLNDVLSDDGKITSDLMILLNESYDQGVFNDIILIIKEFVDERISCNDAKAGRK